MRIVNYKNLLHRSNIVAYNFIAVNLSWLNRRKEIIVNPAMLAMCENPLTIRYIRFGEADMLKYPFCSFLFWSRLPFAYYRFDFTAAKLTATKIHYKSHDHDRLTSCSNLPKIYSDCPHKNGHRPTTSRGCDPGFWYSAFTQSAGTA